MGSYPLAGGGLLEGVGGRSVGLDPGSGVPDLYAN